MSRLRLTVGGIFVAFATLMAIAFTPTHAAGPTRITLDEYNGYFFREGNTGRIETGRVRVRRDQPVWQKGWLRTSGSEDQRALGYISVESW